MNKYKKNVDIYFLYQMNKIILDSKLQCTVHI